MYSAIITDIKHFAVHDGNGIRTTVFFKGCPLKCVWCHNPETISPEKQLAFYEHKCIKCGKCLSVCDYNFQNCDFCGQCMQICPNEARKIYGKQVTVKEVMEELTADRIFYDSSNGGITLSGGECLMQADFCQKLLCECKKEGINTAVDTCGFANKSAFDKVIPYTDIFLYDLKAFDEDVHIKCTGVSNKLILENLKYIDNLGCNTEIRIPYVPQYNDNQIQKLSVFVKQLKNVKKVRVLAYHNYASSKYAALKMENTLPKVEMPRAQVCEQLEKLF